MAETYAGHPMHAGHDSGSLAGRVAEFSIVSVSECLVIDRYFKDEPGNRLRQATEYDVRDLKTGQVIPNVRALQRRAGLEDGEDDVFHPASRALSRGSFSKKTRAADTDGDYVLVAFIGGSRQNAVILGSLTHLSAQYAAKAADGERRFLAHKGTTVQINQDGSFVLARKETTVSVDADGVVRVSAPDVRIGDQGTLRPCAGVGDAISTQISDLVDGLTPYFQRTGFPVLPGAGAVDGEVTSGSAAVKVSR